MHFKVGVAVYILLVMYASWSWASNYGDMSDNEFAEFEDFESDEEVFAPTENQQRNTNEPPKESNAKEKDGFVIDEDEQDVIIEEDSEFEYFQDPDEFEGLPDGKDVKGGSEPKITITKVPIHFRANWDSYWLEILMVTGLVVYFINFAAGKSKNAKLANTFLNTHRTLLEDNFALVGDDSSPETKENGGFLKESENVFTLWCSGRTCCEGMLVELKLIKRQDLVAIIAGMMRPTCDQIHVKVLMNKEDMDSFVFAVATKKTAAHLAKEMADISMYCPERRAGDKHNIPAHFQIMSEIAEVTPTILDAKLTAILNKYGDLVDYIHLTDQYAGLKQTDDGGATLKLPDTQKMLLFGFNIALQGKGASIEHAIEQLKPLMTMVIYCIDRVKRYRLSKEGKAKADKNRQRVEEAFLKSTHVARAEAYAQRREDRRRQEKERIMADSDPEKQRRWEEKEQKRQLKKRAPRMKQLKVKAL